MITYYLLQHLAVAIALACCAVRMPQWFHLSRPVRLLLAASLTPQAIGLIVMALAFADINTQAIYLHAPIILAVLLIALLGPGSARHLLRSAPRMTLALPNILIAAICCFVAVVLAGILYDNAGTLNVTAHDFNVYLSGAKSFASSPGIASIPGFYGGPGDVIVVHPHSFLYEAYLSHALVFQGIDTSFPPLDFLPRLAQQLSILYLLVSIAAVAVAIGGRRAVVPALCLALCVPWVLYYVVGGLSSRS